MCEIEWLIDYGASLNSHGLHGWCRWPTGGNNTPADLAELADSSWPTGRWGLVIAS